MEKKDLPRRRTLAKHQMTEQEYEALVVEQNDKCAICHADAAYGKRLGGIPPRPWFIDRDPTSDLVRGLLCVNCISMLGHAHSSITTLKNAIAYLEGQYI